MKELLLEWFREHAEVTRDPDEIGLEDRCTFNVAGLAAYLESRLPSKTDLLALIAHLEDDAAKNQRISEKGSIVTSMAEDVCLGNIAIEQLRIVRKLKAIGGLI